MRYEPLAAKKLLKIKSLGELKDAGYQPKSVKDELRDNLIRKINEGGAVFPGIWGYEETVVPDLERALLSRSARADDSRYKAPIRKRYRAHHYRRPQSVCRPHRRRESGRAQEMLTAEGARNEARHLMQDVAREE